MKDSYIPPIVISIQVRGKQPNLSAEAGNTGDSSSEMTVP